MDLSGLGWQQLPWVKATVGQWRYALRNAIAMCLALSVAYALQLDEPYWAMTSAAVVSFPTVGGVISKSLGRIAGSLLGAAAALMISGHTLNDLWLFAFSIAGWLAGCTWISNHYQNNVAYAFSLAGYTAAIIAFNSVNIVEIESIWTIAQARVCEVISGILCGALMMMVLPSTSDGDALIKSLKDMHIKLLDHTHLLLHSGHDDDMRCAHESVIGQILTMNLLRVQAFWSHYRFRRQNNVLNYVLHQQLRLTSVISSLRRMLLDWENAPASLLTAIHLLLAELARPDANKYRLAQILLTAAPRNKSDYRHKALWDRLRYFCWLYLNISRWLRQFERADGKTTLSPPQVPALARKADGVEAGWNALRTFAVIVMGCSFWITTQWSAGASALTLAAISCVLYSSSPSPTGSVSLLLKTLGLLAIFSFVMKFGFMVQVTSLWQFIAILFPLLLTLQLFKLQQKKRAALWGQLIVFMGSFLAVTNPPTYEYLSFINDNLAKICGVILVWLAFHILRPSSDQRRSLRHIRAIKREFADRFLTHPHRSQESYESLIYHLINQLNSSGDHLARLWLARWGVVLLNCSHIAWQLREWQTCSPELNQVRDAVLSDLQNMVGDSDARRFSSNKVLERLQQRIDLLTSSREERAAELAGIVWRLACSLTPLKSA